MEKIKRCSLADEAYERIKKEIMQADFFEGKKIPSENQLSKKLSVSRVVVREALSRLRSEKIIVTYQGKGSFKANPKNFEKSVNTTSEFDFDNYRRIMEFREAIETFAVSLAVKEASDQELSRLAVYAEKMANADSADDFNARDYEFHLALVECAHNEYFISSYQALASEIFGVLELMNQIESSREYAIKLHKDIAESLRQRNAKNAIKLLNENGEYNAARILEIYKK